MVFCLRVFESQFRNLAEIVEFQFLMQAQKDLILMFNKSKKGQKNELFYISVQIKNGNSIIANFTQFLCIEMICFGWVGFFDREQMLRGLVFFFQQ